MVLDYHLPVNSVILFCDQYVADPHAYTFKEKLTLHQKCQNWDILQTRSHIFNYLFEIFQMGAKFPKYLLIVLNFAVFVSIFRMFCLFGLRLYVPVNNFSVMSGRNISHVAMLHI